MSSDYQPPHQEVELDARTGLSEAPGPKRKKGRSWCKLQCPQGGSPSLQHHGGEAPLTPVPQLPRPEYPAYMAEEPLGVWLVDPEGSMKEDLPDGNQPAVGQRGGEGFVVSTSSSCTARNSGAEVQEKGDTGYREGGRGEETTPTRKSFTAGLFNATATARVSSAAVSIAFAGGASLCTVNISTDSIAAVSIAAASIALVGGASFTNVSTSADSKLSPQTSKSKSVSESRVSSTSHESQFITQSFVVSSSSSCAARNSGATDYVERGEMRRSPPPTVIALLEYTAPVPLPVSRAEGSLITASDITTGVSSTTAEAGVCHPAVSLAAVSLVQLQALPLAAFLLQAVPQEEDLTLLSAFPLTALPLRRTLLCCQHFRCQPCLCQHFH
ncbi:UNVERIFIED_CONTAM: hypothetical protein FKN15_012023 [Acipenser sinensis]